MPDAVAWMGLAALTDPPVIVLGAVLVLIAAVLLARFLLVRSDRQVRASRLAHAWQALADAPEVFPGPVELPLPQIRNSKFVQTVRGVQSFHQLLKIETDDGLQASLVVVGCQVMRKKPGGGQKLTAAHVHMARIEGLASMPDFVLTTRDTSLEGGMLGMSVGKLKQDPRFDARFAVEGDEFARIRAFFKPAMVECALGFLDAARRAGLFKIPLTSKGGRFVGPRIESDGRSLLVSRPRELEELCELSAEACSGQPLSDYHKRIVCEGLQLARAISSAQAAS